jgi:hypothetical protein
LKQRKLKVIHTRVFNFTMDIPMYADTNPSYFLAGSPGPTSLERN